MDHSQHWQRQVDTFIGVIESIRARSTKRNLIALAGPPASGKSTLAGFSHMIDRLGEKREVYVPAFDRANDQTINCAYPIPDYHDIVIIEGNYLLLNEPKWSALDELWDFAIFIEISIEEVERRATERWITAGLSPEMITKRVEENDLHNAERVLRNRVPEDLVLRGDL
jgi:pantothenate kinase